MSRNTTLIALSLFCASCASNSSSNSALDLFDMSPISGKQFERVLAEASKHPLGSMENPVRATLPPGQRAYLERLRCADGKAPEFDRVGSMGDGPYRSIVDGYDVRCPGSSPAQSTIMLDMYHDHVETRAVPGFTIVAP